MDGRIRRTARHTMVGMVPAARHSAVSIPTKRRVMRMFFTVLMPDRAKFSTVLNAYPLRTPYAVNSTSPSPRAYRMEISRSKQANSEAQKTPKVIYSIPSPRTNYYSHYTTGHPHLQTVAFVYNTVCTCFKGEKNGMTLIQMEYFLIPPGNAASPGGFQGVHHPAVPQLPSPPRRRNCCPLFLRRYPELTGAGPSSGSTPRSSCKVERMKQDLATSVPTNGASCSRHAPPGAGPSCRTSQRPS